MSVLCVVAHDEDCCLYNSVKLQEMALKIREDAATLSEKMKSLQGKERIGRTVPVVLTAAFCLTHALT